MDGYNTISTPWDDFRQEITFFQLEETICRDNITTLRHLINQHPNWHILTDDNGTTLLHVAIEYGQSSMAIYLLNNGYIDANARNSEGFSVLHTAALMGHRDRVRILTEAGADLNHSDQRNRSVLYTAIHGDSLLRTINYKSTSEGAALDDRLKTVMHLIRSGCDVRACTKVGDSVLHAAVIEGLTDIVPMLLDANVDVNMQNQHGVTPLHVACERGPLVVVNMLIDAGAETSARDDCGNTVLHFAARGGQFVIVQRLVELIDYSVCCNEDDSTILHIAAQHGHIDIVKIFLQIGACDINARDIDGQTPLHRAARGGHLHTMQVLLDNGANAHERDLWGDTVLHAAVSGGHLTAIGACLKLVDVDSRNLCGVTAFYSAAKMGLVDVLRLLLNTTQADIHIVNIYGNNALHGATEGGAVNTVSMLIDLFELDAQNNIGRTALRLAAYYGHIDIIQLLMDAGADPNLKDGWEWSPLLVASVQGHLDIVKLLLTVGDVNTHFDDGDCLPLHSAADMGHMDVIRVLEGANADFTARDHIGRDTLHFAVRGGRIDVINYLLQEKSMSVHSRCNNGRGVLHIAASRGHVNLLRMFLNEFDIGDRDNFGSTALSLAADFGQIDAVKFLIEAKSNVNCRDNRGASILHGATQMGHVHIVELLLDNKADVNLRTFDGNSVLHTAILAGHIDIAMLLIEANADVNAPDNIGRTVLQAAIWRGYSDIAKLLIERGAQIPRGVRGYKIFQLIVENNLVEVMKCIIDARRSAPAAEEWGYSALAIAAEYDNVAMAEELLRFGVALPPYRDRRWTELAQFASACNNDFIAKCFGRF